MFTVANHITYGKNSVADLGLYGKDNASSLNFVIPSAIMVTNSFLFIRLIKWDPLLFNRPRGTKLF